MLDGYVEYLKNVAMEQDDYNAYCMSDKVACFLASRLEADNDEYNEFISVLPEFDLADVDFD